MIDLHSHLLYGLDDGATNIEMSVRLIASAYQNGFKDIVLTPHYIEDSEYDSDVENNSIKLMILKRRLIDENIPVNLYLGNEVYATTNMINLLNDKKISTINNSKYLLFELPLEHEEKNLWNIISILQNNHIVPIIAHPERYQYLSINQIKELNEHNVLFQLNMGSLIGKYGRSAQKKAKKLVKLNLIQLVGSDTHRSSIFSDINEIKKIIDKINNDSFNNYFIINPTKVLNNEDLK